MNDFTYFPRIFCLQVMLKVKNELTHAKFDLERAIKIRQGVSF